MQQYKNSLEKNKKRILNLIFKKKNKKWKIKSSKN